MSEEEKLYRDGAICKVRLFLASLFTLESGSCTGIQSHAVIKPQGAPLWVMIEIILYLFLKTWIPW
jgi:hypothetical protein